jgi:hypothetical protein
LCWLFNEIDFYFFRKANQFEEKGVTTMWMNGTFKCINNLPIIGTLDTENLMKTWKSIHSGMTDYIDVNANAPTPMDNFVYEKWEGKDDSTYYEVSTVSYTV